MKNLLNVNGLLVMPLNDQVCRRLNIFCYALSMLFLIVVTANYSSSNGVLLVPVLPLIFSNSKKIS